MTHSEFNAGSIDTVYLELAELLGSRECVDSMLLGFLHTNRADVSEGSSDVFAEYMPDSIDESLLEDTLGFLDSTGIIESRFDAGTLVYRLDIDAVLEALMGARRMIVVLDRIRELDNSPDVDVLATIPDSDPAFAGKQPLDFGLDQITSRLLGLCGTATSKIILLSPFLESEGITWLTPGIQGALDRGVDVTLISKELGPEQPNRHAVETFIALDTPDRDGSVSVYDYYEPSPKTDDDYPLYTLHAKLMLVDDKRLYLGSANFTENAFTRYLEAGVILEGPQVLEVSKLIQFLREESAEQIYP